MFSLGNFVKNKERLSVIIWSHSIFSKFTDHETIFFLSELTIITSDNYRNNSNFVSIKGKLTVMEEKNCLCSMIVMHKVWPSNCIEIVFSAWLKTLSVVGTKIFIRYISLKQSFTIVKNISQPFQILRIFPLYWCLFNLKFHDLHIWLNHFHRLTEYIYRFILVLRIAYLVNATSRSTLSFQIF